MMEIFEVNVFHNKGFRYYPVQFKNDFPEFLTCI